MPEAEFKLNEPNALLPAIIHQLVFEDNLLRRLNGIDTLLSSLDNDLALKVDAKKHKKWIKEYLNNIDFIRKLSLHCKVVEIPETALELYSMDYLTHPEFNFDEKFNQEIIRINSHLSEIIGIIIKEYSAEEEIEF